MTQEQKAKAYEEALERAESIYNEIAIPSATAKGICTYIFPELKERDDVKYVRKDAFIEKALEWIRKEIRPYYHEVRYKYEDFKKYMSE